MKKENPNIITEPPPNALPREHFPLRSYSSEITERKKEKDDKGQDKNLGKQAWNFIKGHDRKWETNKESKFQTTGEKNVHEALKSPMPKMLIEAMRSIGCPFNLSRHVSVEACSPSVASGYDPIHKQIIISQDAALKDTETLNKLVTAELIQMFDQCRANTDFSDIRHLACSQIRAVAQTRCKTRTKAIMETGELWKNGEHEICVKVQSLTELGLLRPNINKVALWDAVDSVFAPCFGDTEPFGRIVRENSEEPKLIWAQRRNYGYY